MKIYWNEDIEIERKKEIGTEWEEWKYAGMKK